VTWWAGAPEEDRRAALSLPLVQQRLGERADWLAALPVLPDDVRDALIEVVMASSAELVILPVQDVFGWADRINTPAIVDDVNWTWRLPWPVETIDEQPAARRATALLRQLAERYDRTR
jgi:4-alpha-glucanotransferase